VEEDIVTFMGSTSINLLVKPKGSIPKLVMIPTSPGYHYKFRYRSR